MTEYLVFPIPVGFEKINASSVQAARNKYRTAMPDMNEEELIIVPSTHAQKTSIDIIVPLCNTYLKKKLKPMVRVSLKEATLH